MQEQRTELMPMNTTARCGTGAGRRDGELCQQGGKMARHAVRDTGTTLAGAAGLWPIFNQVRHIGWRAG